MTRTIGQVYSIKAYGENDRDGMVRTKGRLVRGRGLEGDINAVGGDRQLSLITKTAKDWMARQKSVGFCIRRFKENLVMDMDFKEALVTADYLNLGEAKIKITQQKGCHEGCPFLLEKEQCMVKNNIFFAKVTKGGRIAKGELIQRETKTK